MITMISLVTISSVTVQSYYNIIHYIPYAVQRVPVIYLLYNWTAVSLLFFLSAYQYIALCMYVCYSFMFV